MPLSEGSKLPDSPSGILFSLADKLDNLISYTKIGIKPSASKDPYALRRNAISFLRILVEKGLSLDLTPIIQEYGALDLLTFLQARLPSLFKEYGLDPIEIQYAKNTKGFDPYDLFLRAKAIHDIRQTDDTFDDLLALIKRLKGQINNQPQALIKSDLLKEEIEKEFHQKIITTKETIEQALKEKEYSRAILDLVKIKDPLALFFEKIKINCEDEKVRINRTALLQELYTTSKKLLEA